MVPLNTHILQIDFEFDSWSEILLIYSEHDSQLYLLMHIMIFNLFQSLGLIK